MPQVQAGTQTGRRVVNNNQGYALTFLGGSASASKLKSLVAQRQILWHTQVNSSFSIDQKSSDN